LSGPGLKPEQRSNPTSYVTARDLRESPVDLVDTHAGELLQWRRRDELSPTALCIAGVLLVFRGLRGGRDGCGVQMNVDDWAELLGRSRRMVQYAFAQLELLGWVWRRRRFVKVDWEDEAGNKFKRADVWGVAYLSTKGAVQLQRRGETKRLVSRRGATRRLLMHEGLVGSLMKAFSSEIRAIARRFADVPKHCAPSLRTSSQKQEPGRMRSAPVFPGRLASAKARTRGPSPPNAAGGGEWGRERVARELERLRGMLALTPAQAWPEAFFAPTTDDRGRRWLADEFERFRPELEAHFEAHATPAQRKAHAAAVAAAAKALEQLERNQPTQRQRVLRERLYAEGGPGRYLQLAELRKVQAAMRADGDLPPKRRRSKKIAAGGRKRP
jgi:hypothetical protein